MVQQLCWWCCHPPIEGTFIHMPIKQNKDTKTYTTIGNFCSWECMKAYAIDKYSTHITGIICMYMRCMRSDKGVLRCAPARNTLQCFGGPLTIEEFRKNSSTTMKSHLPGIDHKIYECVEQKKVQSTQGNSEDKMRSINSATCENESLRLKRTKPLKRDAKNNLEKSLGIVKKQTTLPIGRA